MRASDKKIALRKSLMTKRRGLEPVEVNNCSEKILNTLRAYLYWAKIKRIHTYLPIENNNEINTVKFIDFIKQNYPDISIEIAPNKVIANSEVPSVNQYDLMIVPLLGFDRRGFRLGYGGGYYDKFLAKNSCKQVIGLGYSFSEMIKCRTNR